ncbi:MAG: Cna B-type domain-containing protein [Clostridia bacterium]|nr:Cna B-type domain-containing protein [Clostridia bacterium]
MDAEGVNPVTGTPRGSTATPNPGYTFVGWYADEACTQLLSTNATYVPTKSSSQWWIDGTTYYAKFVEDSVTLRFIAEDNVDHVELVTDAGDVIFVQGNGTKEMSVGVSKLNGPAVTVRGVAADGYVIKEWTIDGRDGALTTNDEITTAITDDPTATNNQWTDRTYHVWAETSKHIDVSKQVETVGTVLDTDIDITVYFALKRKDTGDWVYKDGNIWVQSINVVDGVPEAPNKVTFDGLTSGTYEVWEVADPNASSLKPGDIVIERDSQQKEVLVATIHTIHNGGNSNNITLSETNPADSMTVVNTYSHRDEYKNVTARKYWYTTKNNTQNDQQNVNVPAGAWAELTLFNGEEAVRTIRLDGVVDEDGETEPWVATFDGVGNVDSAGNTITYTIRETGYSNPLNGQYYYQLKAETSEGGAVSNAVLYGNINVYKQIEVQPRNSEMDALVRQGVAALQIHLTGPYGYDETFTFQNPGDPYNMTLNIPDLPAGKYYIEELNYVDLITGRKWNPTDSWIKVEKMSRDDDGILNVQQKGKTGSYIYVATNGQSNDSTDVRFHNDYLKYDVTATKVWHDNGVANPEHPSVNITLYQIDASGNRKSVSTKIIGANQTGDGLTVKWEQLEQQEQQYSYEVEEGDVEGYILESITGDMFSGFTVTNMIAPKVNLTKMVTGNMAETDKQFTFTITAKDANGQNATFKVNNETITGGTATLTLAHEETAKLNFLIGTTVTITEDPDGYDLTSASGATNGSLDGDTHTYTFTMAASEANQTITFTNDLSQTVDTGVELHSAPYWMILGLCMIELMMLCRRRRRRE